jgi:peptidoglycan/LPS O-acetylase OafA/YrhL
VLDGGHAVGVFFALSGFVIALLLGQKRERYGVFIARRWCRIFPAFAVCVLTGAMLSALGLMPDRTDPRTDWLHAIAHLTMLHGVIPNEILNNAAGSFLNPAWSISVEWQFYLVAPLILWALLRHPIFAWVALLMSGAFARRVALGFDFGGASLVWQSQFFVLGIVSYASFAWASTHRETLHGRGSVIAIALPLLPLIVAPIALNVGVLVWLALLGVALAAMLDGEDAAMPLRWSSAVLTSPAALWLGSISYSLYLGHEPFVWLAKAAIKRSGAQMEGLRLTTAVGLLSAPVSLAAAALLYRWVEIPGISLGKRIGHFGESDISPISEIEVAQQASP